MTTFLFLAIYSLIRLFLVYNHGPAWCFPGYNQWGELGLGDKNDRGDEQGEMGDDLPFVNLGDNIQVAQISLGDWHT